MVRWLLKFAIQRLAAQGFDKFLDLASGLPTVDHIHETAPSGTTVLYSDIDPIVVAYGQEIIGDNPHVRFVQGDCRRPEELLRAPVIQELFGDDRRVAIIFSGIAPYLEPDEMRHTMRTIYDWAAKGSCLAVNAPVMVTPEPLPAALQFVEMYNKRMDSPFNVWSLAVTQDLLLPWQPDEQGFRPATEWLGVNDPMIKKEETHTGWVLYGAFLVK
jgi:O-methyltransferase involved in polyketide biosynthesis